MDGAAPRAAPSRCSHTFDVGSRRWREIPWGMADHQLPAQLPASAAGWALPRGFWRCRRPSSSSMRWPAMTAGSCGGVATSATAWRLVCPGARPPGSRVLLMGETKSRSRETSASLMLADRAPSSQSRLEFAGVECHVDCTFCASATVAGVARSRWPATPDEFVGAKRRQRRLAAQSRHKRRRRR
jgi:hypothetical protein